MTVFFIIQRQIPFVVTTELTLKGTKRPRGIKTPATESKRSQSLRRISVFLYKRCRICRSKSQMWHKHNNFQRGGSSAFVAWLVSGVTHPGIGRIGFFGLMEFARGIEPIIDWLLYGSNHDHDQKFTSMISTHIVLPNAILSQHYALTII